MTTERKCPDCGCCCDYSSPCCNLKGGNIDHPGGCKKITSGNLYIRSKTMDAVEFYKSMKRMCYSGEMCEKCPLYNNFSEMGSVCDVLLHITDEKASKVKSIVEQWAKGHPVKTRKSEFQKMFPDANMYSITTTFCTAHFDKKKACEVSVPSEEMCEKCRYKYWNEEVDE